MSVGVGCRAPESELKGMLRARAESGESGEGDSGSDTERAVSVSPGPEPGDDDDDVLNRIQRRQQSPSVVTEINIIIILDV